MVYFYFAIFNNGRTLQAVPNEPNARFFSLKEEDLVLHHVSLYVAKQNEDLGILHDLFYVKAVLDGYHAANARTVVPLRDTSPHTLDHDDTLGINLPFLQFRLKLGLGDHLLPVIVIQIDWLQGDTACGHNDSPHFVGVRLITTGESHGVVAYITCYFFEDGGSKRSNVGVMIASTFSLINSVADTSVGATL